LALILKLLSAYLEYHFDGEDPGEDEIESVENAVARRMFVDWILGGQSDATRADDDHDEQIEVAKIHDEVAETAQSATQAGGSFFNVVWLGGAVVRALNLRLKIAGSIPAAALSSATLDRLFTHTLPSASEVTSLWRYINQFEI